MVYIEYSEAKDEMKVKVGFRIKPELLCEIDRLRGLVKRSPFVEHLLRLGLEAYLRERGVRAGSFRR